MSSGYIGEYTNFLNAGGYVGEYRKVDEYDCYGDPDVLAGRISLTDCEEKHGIDPLKETREKIDREEKGHFFDKLFGVLDKTIDTADRTADVIHKFKEDGTETEVDGIGYDASLRQKEEKQTDLTAWYIAGGVIVLVVIGAFVIKGKK